MLNIQDKTKKYLACLIRVFRIQLVLSMFDTELGSDEDIWLSQDQMMLT